MTGAGMAGVTYYASNKDDPYITLENPVSKVKGTVSRYCASTKL